MTSWNPAKSNWKYFQIEDKKKVSDRKNGFVPCHPFHHHLNPHPLDKKNCAMPPFHHLLNPHPLDEKKCQGVGVEVGMVVEGWHGTMSKNMPGGGGGGGYGGGRVAWHNVILSDCSFISKLPCPINPLGFDGAAITTLQCIAGSDCILLKISRVGNTHSPELPYFSSQDNDFFSRVSLFKLSQVTLRFYWQDWLGTISLWWFMFQKVTACLILKKEIRLVPLHSSQKQKRNDNNTILGLKPGKVKWSKTLLF